MASRPNPEAHTPLVQPENAEFKLLGKGYEHLVYQHIHHPESAVKISAHKLRQILTAFPGMTRPKNNALASYGRAEFVPDIRSKNAQLVELMRTFGPAHALRERRFLSRVKVSVSFMCQLFFLDYWQRGTPDWVKNAEILWTHVAVQRFCKAASDPSRLSLSFGSFTEDGPFDRPRYRQLHALMLRKSAAAIPLDTFLALQDNSRARYLSRLLRTAERDPGLKAALIDFILKSMTYSRRTGNILALAGQDNVFFFQSAGSWTYCLMDVLPIPTGPVLRHAEEVALRLSGCAPSKQELEAVKRALNFVRTIDGIASALGLEERIGLAPALAAASELDLAPDGRYAF